MKTLEKTNSENARQIVGDVDLWKLLCKASSKDWMKSTEAMEIPGVGCLVLVTTQQGTNVAEAVVFVPDVMIVPGANGGARLFREAAGRSGS
jgi:hypothetical protein